MSGQWGFVTAVALGRVAFGYQFQAMASLGPELVTVFGLDYAALGALIGVYMAPGILVALPGGLLGRRYGERLVVGAGLALMAVGGLVGMAASGPPGIAAGRAVSGAGAVLLVVMQGKMASDRFEGRTFLTVMGLLVGAFPVGVGLAGLSLEPLVRWFGWPGMFGAGAAASAIAFLLFWPSSLPAPPRSVAAWAMPSRRECLLVGVAGLVWTAYNAGYYGFLSYLPSVLASRGHPASLTAIVLTIATWSNLPATVLGGWLAGRFGNTPVFLLGSVASVVSVAGPAVVDWPILWGLLFGTAASLHAGVIVAIGTLSARPENRAAGMGLFYTVYYAGGTGLPALCGLAADLAGHPSGALLAAAAISAIAMPLYALHRRIGQRG
ncbi:MAG: MFS transporter [Gemmatimonadaceae bacterium]|nr:MFS transporter [Acetobacteraceae bacterium]